MLLAGVPLLLLPTQLEQYMAATRVVQLGAGVMVSERPPDEQQPVPKGRQGPAPQKAPEPNYRALLIRLLGRPHFAARAKAFAAKHADFDQAAQCEAMARRMEELLGR
jgi:hypothetical protein